MLYVNVLVLVEPPLRFSITAIHWDSIWNCKITSHGEFERISMPLDQSPVIRYIITLDGSF